MCCLNFENITYKTLKKKLPKLGKVVETKQGKGKVIRLNPICSRFTVRLEGGTEAEIGPEDISKNNRQEKR
jgi:cell fate regulator YaaT (PSP1 superfamily)